MAGDPEAAEAPAITVLLPVRNGAATVAAAIGSIAAQSFAGWELLAVDDGSQDATPDVLARLAAQDGRIRVLRQKPEGLVAALNRGLAAARAGLVARMDADDVAHPSRLARQAAAMARAPELALLGTGWRVVGADGAERRVVQPPAGDAALRALMMTANALAHPTCMVRTEAVRRVGGYRAAFVGAEDYDLWLRLMDRYPIGCVPEVLLDYREHAGQVTWRAIEQRIFSELGALAAHDRRQAGRPDLGDDKAPIDAARLLRMGLTAADIGDGIVARALGAAKQARAAGLGRGAREAARLGLRQRGLALRTRAHFAQLWLGLGG